jgi:hypothetical protein
LVRSEHNYNNKKKSQAFLGYTTKAKSTTPSYYHSSDDIHEKLTSLVSSGCTGLTMETRSKSDGSGYDVSVDVVTINRNPDQPKKNKFFVLFGEHARELISPESALHFVESLCGQHGDDMDEAKIDGVLRDSEFQVIVNGNPNSRRKVEEGDYCLRVNGQGVDLNRNWDEKWIPADKSDSFAPADTNPGPRAFSEPETNIFKEAVSAYQPTSFLTIHSGTKGMYMPWAYDMEHLAKKNGKAMFTMLKNLDTEYCQCPFGAAGREVGYSCPGTCLDYVYDELGVEYSFAFEIFTWKQDWPDLKQRFQEKLQQPSDFIQLASHDHMSNKLDDPDECFSRFNPTTESDFKETLVTWSNAYLDLANMISNDIAKKDGSGTSAAEESAVAM